MAQSAVDICNGALQRVGAASILNLLDNSREARACNQSYDSVRRAELRKHYWNFAMKRAALAADVVAPVFEFAYQFPLPADCLRVRIPNDPYLDWKLEGRKILTNTLQSPFLGSSPNSNLVSSSSSAPLLNLRYVADIEDASIFDPIFYSMLSVSIALEICERITNSATKKSALGQEYKMLLAEAKQADAFENLPQEAPDDEWWLARY